MNGSRFDVYEVRAASSVSSDDVYPPRHFNKQDAVAAAEAMGCHAWVVCHDVATGEGNGVDSYVVYETGREREVYE